MNERQKSFWFAAGIGVFVAAFLLMFRPFDLKWYGLQDPTFWFVLGLAPFNMGLILLLDVIFSRLQQRWTWLRYTYANLFGIVVLVVFGNVAYQVMFQQDFRGIEILSITGRVALVAVFPTLFIILYHRQHRAATVTASPIIGTPPLCTLRDETNKEALSLPADDLLFIVADRNYALVHTRTAERPYLLRTSLKALEGQLANTSVVRCHRSYLVNTAQVLHRRRHARGLHLTLRDTEISVPVSASFMDSIEHYLAT